MKKTILKPADGQVSFTLLLRRYRRSPLNVAPDRLRRNGLTERPDGGE